MVILIPAFSYSLFSVTRNASRRVMSASSNCVTCGIITQLRARLAPEIFRIRDSGTASIGPELREIRRRPRQKVECAGTRRRCCRTCRRTRAACERALDERLHVVLEDASLGPAACDTRKIGTEFARNRRTEGDACALRLSDPGLACCDGSVAAGVGRQGGGRTRLREARARVGTCDRGRGEVAVVRMRRRRRAAARFRTRLCRLQRHDRRPFADALPHRDAHAFYDAADRRRHFHRRLVRFERHERDRPA